VLRRPHAPLGPSVTDTALASRLTPRSMAARPSLLNLTSLCAATALLELCRAGQHGADGAVRRPTHKAGLCHGRGGAGGQERRGAHGVAAERGGEERHGGG
jgi:hypothetical protein